MSHNASGQGDTKEIGNIFVNDLNKITKIKKNKLKEKN